MSNRISGPDGLRADFPVAVEFLIVAAALLGLSVWMRIVTASAGIVSTVAPPDSGLLLHGLLIGGLSLLAVGSFAGMYAWRRNIDVDLSPPTVDDVPSAALAVAVPAVLVGVTKLVGVATGVPFGSLITTSYSERTTVASFLIPVGLGIYLGVPSLLVVYQLVVQRSFARVVDGSRAVALTTALAGFVAVSETGGLTAFPDRGKLLGVALFALALGVGLYATRRVDRRWLRYCAWAPAALLAVLVVASGVAEVDSLAGGLYGLSRIVVLATAAYTYERTGSLAVPALAYASVRLTGSAVVFVFEAGLQGW